MIVVIFVIISIICIVYLTIEKTSEKYIGWPDYDYALRTGVVTGGGSVYSSYPDIGPNTGWNL